MLTRIVAKQANTTKVKNKFFSGKKSSKEHSVVFLVEGEKFNLGERNSAIKFRQKVHICLVGSVQTRSAHRLSSQLFAVVSMPNIAELVLFGFSVHNNGFYGISNTFCQEKHRAACHEERNKY